MRLPNRRALTALCGAVSAAALTALGTVTPAPAATTYPVNYNFANGFANNFGAPTDSPPGANKLLCHNSAHPIPVLLVHGTWENQNDNWQAAAPILANHGYCVYTLNYGGNTSNADVQGVGDIADSAKQLQKQINLILFWTGSSKIDIVGHSQGGMMPRYYINSLGGASKVDKLVALAPSNYGTTLDGLTDLGNFLGLLAPVNAILGIPCAACTEQEIGSSFLASLNAAPTNPNVQYTVIESTGDEVVTPYTNAFLPAAPNVTNITVNDQCSVDKSDHLEIAADPTAMADMLNALDPAHPVTVPCVPVNPGNGPTGTVPSF